MVRVLFFSILVTLLASSAVLAQDPARPAPAQGETNDIIARAERHLVKGESCFQTSDMECARREFDLAIDAFIESGTDVRGDARLQQAWRDAIERINRHQVEALNGARAGLWKSQEFTGKPDKQQAQASSDDDEWGAAGPLTPVEFQKQFAELRSRFRDAYDRDIVLTGADHDEHRRLYGRGSAFDIRARDLNREQVRFIISEGKKLGLRIKDFSTWQKVSAHNARVLGLGRPLDTLATGLHLHIDRMAAPRKKSMGLWPATKRVRRGSADSK
jgi:hypothetical protein